jgi:hypothetical protein
MTQVGVIHELRTHESGYLDASCMQKMTALHRRMHISQILEPFPSLAYFYQRALDGSLLYSNVLTLDWNPS